MAMGFDMMISAIAKAAGIDLQALRPQIENYIVTGMEQFHYFCRRQEELHTKIDFMNMKVDTILAQVTRLDKNTVTLSDDQLLMDYSKLEQ